MRKIDYLKQMSVTVIGAGMMIFSSCQKEPIMTDVKDASGSHILITTPIPAFLDEYTLGALDAPAMGKASNGMTVSVSGAGGFREKGKAAYGGGEYYSDDPMIGAGTWTANQLSTFESYGNDGDGSVGGRVIVSVTLNSNSGKKFQAMLQMQNCIGNSPTSCAEGVRLDIKGGLNFNEEICGPVTFN